MATRQIEKKGHNFAIAYTLDAIFFSKDAKYPSSYLLSTHYIGLTA